VPPERETVPGAGSVVIATSSLASERGLTDPSAERTMGSAVRWASLSQIFRQATQLITILVLARTLAPADFGLVTVALVLVGFLTLFRDMGVGSAVIQRGEASQEWLSTLFWMAMLVGLVVTAGVFLSAPLLAEALREPRLTSVLRALAVAFLLSGFGVVQQAMLERQLRYFAIARVEMLAAFLGSAVAIAAALGGAGVWSLVGQVLAIAGCTSALMWTSSPWRPTRLFRWDAARAGGGFGAGLTAFNAANYLARNADYLMIGRVLGSTALGYYALAYRLMLLPMLVVTSVVNRVMFPGLARLRGDNDAMARLYLAGVESIAFAAFPISLGLAAVAHRLIPVALGPGWEQAAPVAVLLSIVGLLQSLGGTVGPVFLAYGEIRRMAIWGFVSTTFVIAGFAIGLRWGIVGVAGSYVVVSLALLYPSFRLALRPMNIGVASIVRAAWRSMLVASLMTIFVVAIGAALADHLGEPVTLAIQLAAGTVSYFAVSVLLNRRVTEVVLRRLLHP